MKKIAFWAREHKRAARFTIIACYLFLNIIGLFLGDLIHSFKIEFTPLFFGFVTLMTIFGWMIYPSKSRKYQYKNFFARQKSADLLLISATFLFIVYVGNSLNSHRNSYPNSLQAASIVHTNTGTNVSANTVAKTNLSKKSLRKKIRTEFKKLRKAYKESSDSQKTIYIILAVLAAAGLVWLLSAAACSISCSGSEALAIVVFTLGLGGIVFGLVKLIQRITRGKPKG